MQEMNGKRGSGRIAIPTPTSTDFDYNRRSWPMYAEAIRRAGGTPVEVDLGLQEREVTILVRDCDGILLPGSPADVDPRSYGQNRVSACAPADDRRERVDRLLLGEAYRAGMPVLGICFGAQMLNVWRGGSLVQDVLCVPVNHSAGASVAVAHSVTLLGDGVLQQVADQAEGEAGGRFPVNSSHHQVIDRVGDGLRVTAVSSEDGVIEAIEGSDVHELSVFVLGVQWHPERSTELSGTSRGIFRAFMEAVAVRTSVNLSLRQL